MSEQAPDRFWSGIEISKVIAGTLAAITAAVIGSFLGVAGTLAGAAVASVVGSVGTELYQRSLSRGAKRLGQIAPTFVKAPAAVGTPEVAAATEDESPSHTVPPRRTIRWGHVAIAATTLFVLAMGSLTVYELIAGKSMASTVGTSSGRTSVSSIFDRGSDETKAPEVTPSTDPSGDTSTDAPEAPSSEAPATPEPGATPTTTAPADPAEPTTAPATPEPQQTPPTDTQDQEQQNLNQDTDQDSDTTQ